MANNLIPEELNALIQQYLTDGVLTAKERQVILNKAEKMGIDRDEIDLYLDAEVQKIDQQTDAAVRKQKGKTCPFCGGSVPQLTDKCPHCGENITPEASSELQEIVDNLEEALVDFKSGNDIAKSKATVERFMRKAKLYYGNNPKIQKLLEDVEMESLEAENVAKANARKNTFVKILTYNWRITATVIIVALIGIITLFGVLYDEYKIAQKEAQIAQNEAQIENLSEEVSELVDDGNLDKANNKLVNTIFLKDIPIVKYYDPIYLKVIKAHIKHGNYEAAEELALSYRGKIGSDYWWAKAPTYIYLRSLYEKEGRDFSALKSSDD